VESHGARDRDAGSRFLGIIVALERWIRRECQDLSLETHMAALPRLMV
jgi:hypothetical protein